MIYSKNRGFFAGWMAAALVLASCSNEGARSPDPAAGEGQEAPAAAVKEAQATTPPEGAGAGAGKDSQAAAEKPAGEGTAATEAEAAEAEKADGSGKATAKPSAPVQVTAKLRPGAADLEVVFGSDGTGVSVKVWGTDGLRVKSAAEPMSGAAVSKGQTLKVSVLFDAPAAQANLAVGVNGTFNGKSQGKVQSFTVNPPATTTEPAGSKETNSGAIEPAKDSSGRRVKVMKAP